MIRTNQVSFNDGKNEFEYQIGEPKLKTVNGIEMLLLPMGDAIPLSQIKRFNGISFYQ